MATEVAGLNKLHLVVLSLLFCVDLAVASCPSSCQCSTGKVDCTSAGLDSWPSMLPSNTSTLILTWNQLRTVEAADLDLYPSLKTLVLAHNEIVSIDVGLQEKIEILDLSHNQLQELSFLGSFPKLRHLNMAYNLLDAMDNDTLANSTRLQWLSLHSNPITQLESGTFHGCEMLEYLSLSGLDITDIPAKLLDPLTRLKQLEIRDNALLTELHDDVFYYQGSLRFLHMANNSLRSIPRSIRQLDSLRSLNLDENPFQCDCHMFWFANWLEKRAKLELSQSMICSDQRPLIEQLWRLHCSAVRLETSTLFQKAVLGESVVLTCNFSGNPPPRVTWVTPDRTVLRWPDDANQTEVQLLSSGQLQVTNLTRHTAGDYACHASNALSNVTAFMQIQITPSSFRKVQIQSILTGFGCVFGFVFITMIVQGFRYLMDRCGWWECCYCCGERLSPRAKQIRNLLEAIEQYKSQQLDRLRDNYNGQVHRIRENCVQQIERIQMGYSGQVKYLRGVRDYGTQQLSTIREQYNDQAKKVYDYTVERLQTVQRNYVSQRAKVRKFSAHQLIRLREKYKFQQKTLNKILENLPAFYIDSCRSATCARTDSIYFQDEVDVDVVESIIKQGITLDLPDVCLDDDDFDALPDVADNGIEDELGGCARARKKAGHGRQASAGSLDLSFLFPPLRLPSLNWRRRNVAVDEEPPANDTVPTAVQVAVEICPIPFADVDECSSQKSNE